MRIKQILFALCILLCLTSDQLLAQTEAKSVLPYAEIPAAADEYSAAAVLSRMIDGLGFRYYWGTEGLRSEDLLFTPGNDGRNCGETLDHILALSRTIKNATSNSINERLDDSILSWEEKRAATLNNLKEASENLDGLKDSKIGELELRFMRDGTEKSFPLWNLINGPLADAMYHTGQIVSYRRSAGNPIPPGVNLFMGTKKHEH